MSFLDDMNRRRDDLEARAAEVADRHTMEGRLADEEKLLQVRILESERDFLDEYARIFGVSRTQAIRAMIHSLRDPAWAVRVADKVESLPERPADVAKRERTRAARAAWAEKHKTDDD